jgi:hypothetical protein
MGVPAFVTLVFVAAAVLALWLDVRLGGMEPSSMTRIILHALIAMLALDVAKNVVVAADGPTLTMLVLFGVFLPALVYVFLASLWVLKMVRGAMPR